MKAKEWREVTERFIKGIEEVYDYNAPSPTITENMSVADYRLACEQNLRSVAEGRLELIKTHIKVFKEYYLDRERCDDFDEYERSIG